MNARPAALIYSGGHAHPFAQTTQVLAEMLSAAGYEVTVTENYDEISASLGSTRLLAINALRWSMMQDDKYARFRADHAAALTDRDIAPIGNFVAEGGRLLAIHTATICWDTAPAWRRLLGGGWEWGWSYHPPLGAVDIAITSAGARLTGRGETFTVIDEAYHRLDPSSECIILAQIAAAEGSQPVAWLRRHGRGRVAVDALGHDACSLGQPDHALLLGSMIGWLGRDDA